MGVPLTRFELERGSESRFEVEARLLGFSSVSISESSREYELRTEAERRIVDVKRRRRSERSEVEEGKKVVEQICWSKFIRPGVTLSSPYMLAGALRSSESKRERNQSDLKFVTTLFADAILNNTLLVSYTTNFCAQASTTFIPSRWGG